MGRGKGSEAQLDGRGKGSEAYLGRKKKGIRAASAWGRGKGSVPHLVGREKKSEPHLVAGSWQLPSHCGVVESAKKSLAGDWFKQY